MIHLIVCHHGRGRVRWRTAAAVDVDEQSWLCLELLLFLILVDGSGRAVGIVWWEIVSRRTRHAVDVLLADHRKRGIADGSQLTRRVDSLTRSPIITRIGPFVDGRTRSRWQNVTVTRQVNRGQHMLVMTRATAAAAAAAKDVTRRKLWMIRISRVTASGQRTPAAVVLSSTQHVRVIVKDVTSQDPIRRTHRRVANTRAR